MPHGFCAASQIGILAVVCAMISNRRSGLHRAQYRQRGGEKSCTRPALRCQVAGGARHAGLEPAPVLVPVGTQFSADWWIITTSRQTASANPRDGSERKVEIVQMEMIECRFIERDRCRNLTALAMGTPSSAWMLGVTGGATPEYRLVSSGFGVG
jgi:hypothetical protein